MTAHPQAKASKSMAGLFQMMHKHAEAEPLYRQALEITRKVQGEQNPVFLDGLNSLSSLLRATGRPAEAEPLLRQAVELARRLHGEDHSDFLQALNNLAGVLQYCVQNNYLSGGVADTAKDALLAKVPGAQQSSDFTSGSSGSAFSAAFCGAYRSRLKPHPTISGLESKPFASRNGRMNFTPVRLSSAAQ